MATRVYRVVRDRSRWKIELCWRRWYGQSGWNPTHTYCHSQEDAVITAKHFIARWGGELQTTNFGVEE